MCPRPCRLASHPALPPRVSLRKTRPSLTGRVAGRGFRWVMEGFNLSHPTPSSPHRSNGARGLSLRPEKPERRNLLLGEKVMFCLAKHGLRGWRKLGGSGASGTSVSARPATHSTRFLQAKNRPSRPREGVRVSCIKPRTRTKFEYSGPVREARGLGAGKTVPRPCRLALYTRNSPTPGFASQNPPLPRREGARTRLSGGGLRRTHCAPG